MTASSGRTSTGRRVKATAGTQTRRRPPTSDTYASVLLLAGESVIAVAERLRHENATLVLSRYGHLMPESEDRTRYSLDDAWSAPAGTDQPRTED